MTLRRILLLTTVAEIATGLALIAMPSVVINLLLGVYAPWTSVSIGRVAGIAMLSLGIGCFPGGGDARPHLAAWRGMLAYNVLVAAYLAYLSVVGGIGGVLLWPAVVLHAVVAAALGWTGRSAATSGK